MKAIFMLTSPRILASLYAKNIMSLILHLLLKIHGGVFVRIISPYLTYKNKQLKFLTIKPNSYLEVPYGK